SDVFKAGVDYAGVHDWSAFLGGGNSAARQLAVASSPVVAIATWKSPVLLIQADDDRNVPFAQTVNLVKLLRQHQVPYELTVIPDEVHDSLLWGTWVRVFSATGEFFDRVLLKGEAVRPAGA